MKEQGHPPYQEVLFIDSATGDEFLCGSTMQPKATKAYSKDGKSYPVCFVPITSASHPFFNKSGEKLVDAEGRIKKFEKRYQQAKTAAVAATTKEVEAPSPAAAAAAKKAAGKKSTAAKSATKAAPKSKASE